MKPIISPKFFLLPLVLFFSNISQAVDVVLVPSAINNRIAQGVDFITGSNTYYKTIDELQKEYRETSQAYAAKFASAANNNNVSLVAYMCATETESENINKLIDFQNTTESDFGLDIDSDPIEISKLHELQAAYSDICSITNEAAKTEVELHQLNARVSLILAESIFYPIYNVR